MIKVAYTLLCFPFAEFETSLEKISKLNNFPTDLKVSQVGSFKDTSDSSIEHIFEIRTNEEENFILIFHNSVKENSCIVTAGQNFKTKDTSK